MFCEFVVGVKFCWSENNNNSNSVWMKDVCENSNDKIY